jgi:hypothetical protein
MEHDTPEPETRIDVSEKESVRYDWLCRYITAVQLPWITGNVDPSLTY